MNCEHCRKPDAICVCERLTRVSTRTQVVILQHPQEQDVLLGTAPLLEVAIGAKRVVGLSWANLAGAIGQPADPARWATLWPSSLPKGATAPGLYDRHGKPTTRASFDGIIVLDGTWSQAKALWWRNAWLLKLGRVVLAPKDAPLYGRVRKEPRKGFVSSLEATADALSLLGEPAETREALRKGMRTLVQRVRDNPALNPNDPAYAAPEAP